MVDDGEEEVAGKHQGSRAHLGDSLAWPEVAWPHVRRLQRAAAWRQRARPGMGGTGSGEQRGGGGGAG